MPRDAGGLASTVLAELAVHEDELVLAADARPASLALRLPFDVESLGRSVEQAARVVAALAGSDAAPPPVVPVRATPPAALEPPRPRPTRGSCSTATARRSGASC